jgi:MYXO-CTERM domain-containing protein
LLLKAGLYPPSDAVDQRVDVGHQGFLASHIRNPHPILEGTGGLGIQCYPEPAAWESAMPLSLLLGTLLASQVWAGDRTETLVWTSSTEGLGAPFSGVDLPSSGGTDLGLGTGDAATITLDWVFPFGGSDYATLTVYSYGVIGLSGTPGARGTSGACVDGSASGLFLAPWWRDWDLDSAGSVQFKDFGSSAAIQWSDLVIDGSANPMQFTAWLYETGEVVFGYEDVWNGDVSVSRGGDGAVGLQNGIDTVDWSCDDRALASGESLWFTPMGIRHFSDHVTAEAHSDWVYQGEATGDEAGYALASAGDLDGDGSDELIVGAPGGSVAYLLTTASPGSHSLADALATLIGDSGDRLGESVSGGQDIDGDGWPDVLVGAPYSDDGGTNAGAATLVLGADWSGVLAVADADATWTGENPSDFAGHSVAILGDVDGDGYADMLIGAPNHDSAASNAGAAYLIRGSATPSSGGLGSADAILLGEAASDYAGFTVAAAADFDDDGTADLVVGAYGVDGGGSEAGAVYLVSGASLSLGSQSLGDFDRVDGGVAGGSAGLGLAVGDLDGDGTGDVLVGSTTADSQAGAVDLLFGDGSWPTDLSSSDGQVTGSSGERLGYGIAVLTVGSDPVAALGAYSNNDADSNAGKIYLVDGDDLSGAASSVARGSLSGPSASAYLGRSVAGLDFDGDGWQDLAAGAWGADGVESAAGAVYVLPGRPTWQDNDADGFLAQDVGGNDCDDNDASTSPGLPDDCNGLDDDCNGTIDDDWPDTDGDGTADCVDSEDCDTVDNDGDGSIDEDTSDTDEDGLCDDLDSEDCDGLDNDGDGFTDEDFPDTDSDGTADCMDVEECDGLDNDGDGLTDEGYDDTDGDGRADCVDNESCDGLDNDGDGRVDEGHPDTDGDGTVDCLDPEECDGVDNDGDDIIDEHTSDIDGDGICDQLDLESCDGVDNDGDDRVDEDYPDTDGDGLADCLDSEECDGLDNDGDGTVDEGYPDSDNDGIADCVDSEECDGLDNDGDDWTDEGFPDSDHDGLVDCLDGEECDGLDNDGDGFTDEGYPDTDGDQAADCIDVEECDAVDNDGDGKIDEGFEDADEDGTPNCLDESPFPIEYLDAEPSDLRGNCATAGGTNGGFWGLIGALGLGMLRRRRRQPDRPLGSAKVGQSVPVGVDDATGLQERREKP